jgi:hypothetical protein
MSGKKQGVQETERERAMAEVAMQRVQDYRQRWMPMQRNLARTVDAMGEGGSAARKQARGIASTETEGQFAGARDTMEKGLAGTVGLGSSKAKLAITGMGDDQASSTGMGLTLAEQQIDDAYTAGLTSIMNLGLGQKATAVQGMSQSAAMSGQRAAFDADSALGRRMGNAQLAGQMVGVGLGYQQRQDPNRGLFGPGYSGTQAPAPVESRQIPGM